MRQAPEISANFDFEAEVWEYTGPAAWFFLSLPPDVADEIDEAHQGKTHGFGSIRVEVSIGATTWMTSVFPDRKLGTFVLPVKKEVRRAEGLEAGSVARVSLRTIA